SIKAISVIMLSVLQAKKGSCKINASGNIVALGGTINSYHDNELIGDSVILSQVEKSRRCMILEEFRQGILKKDGDVIGEALLETFDAVEDPLGKSANPFIDIEKAFKFFNIPLKPQQAV
ncbi:MAG: hypothetical protein JWO53_1202, partial [Chlamydiia bacterium]|nr:hypothetical protein [Chlamydiia bacterium]